MNKYGMVIAWIGIGIFVCLVILQGISAIQSRENISNDSDDILEIRYSPLPHKNLFETAKYTRDAHYLLNNYYIIIEEFNLINRYLQENDIDMAREHLYNAQEQWSYARVLPFPTDTDHIGFIKLKNKILLAIVQYPEFSPESIKMGQLTVDEFYELIDNFSN
jgi:hypothetical protein